MAEKVVQFGRYKTLVGILSTVHNDHTKAVILLNAGHVHRVGPNRIYQQLAQQIMDSEGCCLRFDFSGIGDSMKRTDSMEYDRSTVEETVSAIDYLEETEGIQEAYLVAFCSSTGTALNVAETDRRVKGVMLINSYLLDSSDRDRKKELVKSTAKRYYKKKLFDIQSWKRFFAGKSNGKMILAIVFGVFLIVPVLLGKLLKGSTDKGVAQVFTKILEVCRQDVKLKILYSEGSPTYDSYKTYFSRKTAKMKRLDNFELEVLMDIDHIFTPLWSQKLLINKVHNWFVS